MLAIFHGMIEVSVKVFIDDFSVFGNSFDRCLNNLDKMIQHCKVAHLVLNWEKCHFMVKEEIMLGHKVSEVSLEVEKVNLDVISKLPPPLISKIAQTARKDTVRSKIKQKGTKRPWLANSDGGVVVEVVGCSRDGERGRKTRENRVLEIGGKQCAQHSVLNREGQGRSTI
nr:reverse transcriptase domain-containing protein [Tanacetum cinerariifolium]